MNMHICVCKLGPPLSKNLISSISGKLCMIIIMKMVSTHMFPWSRIIILSLKMLLYNMHNAYANKDRHYRKKHNTPPHGLPYMVMSRMF